jgi:hypothetical protein
MAGHRSDEHGRLLPRSVPGVGPHHPSERDAPIDDHDRLGEHPSLRELGTPAAVSAAAFTGWEDAVGPLLSFSHTRALLGVSRERLDELVNEGSVVALQERSGARRYPAWQFDDSGRPLVALAAAHWTLVDAGRLSPWTAASWCIHPHAELDGRSPRDWARAGDDSDRLADVARRDATRAAQ